MSIRSAFCYTKQHKWPIQKWNYKWVRYDWSAELLELSLNSSCNPKFWLKMLTSIKMTRRVLFVRVLRLSECVSSSTKNLIKHKAAWICIIHTNLQLLVLLWLCPLIYMPLCTGRTHRQVFQRNMSKTEHTVELWILFLLYPEKFEKKKFVDPCQTIMQCDFKPRIIYIRWVWHFDSTLMLSFQFSVQHHRNL